MSSIKARRSCARISGSTTILNGLAPASGTTGVSRRGAGTSWKSGASIGILSLGKPLEEYWNNKDGDDVDHLNHGVDRRTGRVLVGIADGVAGDRRGVGGRAFAAEIALLNIFFGVIPGAAARS